MGKLDGKKVAFIAADGVEQVELTEPWKAVEQEGGQPELISIESGQIQGFEHLDHGDKFDVDKTIDEVSPDDYDNVVLPGGVANPDFLRVNEDVVSFVRDFFEKGKPVASICHGPWTIIETGVVDGMTVTSWPSLRTDLRNAGANWVDQEVVGKRGPGRTRTPGDLPAFNAKLIDEFAEGRHEQMAQAAKS